MSLNWKYQESFAARHIGPDERELQAMLAVLGASSLDEFIDRTIPQAIRSKEPLRLPPGQAEQDLLAQLEGIAAKNQRFKSFIGMGYSDTHTPNVILRNIFQNPGWYTQYTPYQAEIAQGRLEALLNFQTMVMDLTGLEVANASLLDEGTAAAEAMTMALHVKGDGKGGAFFVSELCHPQTIDVVRTRAAPLGIEVVVGDHRSVDLGAKKYFGALVQYPATDGAVHDYRSFSDKVHAAGALVVMATDLLALTLLTPPGELGADVAVGSAQRFGVPMGYGGPHAAFFATRSAYTRLMPGRIIGVSEDAQGRRALRMALQTREQHIRREKATSNICTAQVLLAVIAGMYAVYHGPQGLKAIAERVHGLTVLLAQGLAKLGFKPRHDQFFDTLRVELPSAQVRTVLAAAEAKGMNFRRIDERSIGLSLDETTRPADVEAILGTFAAGKALGATLDELGANLQSPVEAGLRRQSAYLTHPVFNSYHSETEMLRYIRRLEARDLSLTHSMIPLGSCTMKLNATAEMIPVTWPSFGGLHPFAPPSQAAGYKVIFEQLESHAGGDHGLRGLLAAAQRRQPGRVRGPAGHPRVPPEPGAGAPQRVPHSRSRRTGRTRPRAVMAGYHVVVAKCDDQGNIDIADLRAKADEHKDRLAALMVTYPSTHGVFEEGIKEITRAHPRARRPGVHGRREPERAGGAVKPGQLGADVCHINLHKTFCIPHGGGGPGMGPICVAPHLVKFLPGHPVVSMGGADAHRRRLGGAVGQREHPAHLLGLHPDDGRRGADAGDEDGDPERQLHREAAGPALPGALPGQDGRGGARVHRGPAAPEEGDRRGGGGRGQAADGLRLPRADDVLPGGGHADDRADGERVQGGAGSLLRRDDLHPSGDPRDRRGQDAQGQQRPEERAAHGSGDHGAGVEPAVLAREGGVPHEVGARGQVLAGGGAPEQRAG